MKWIWFIASLIINTIIVTPLIWVLPVDTQNYSFLLAALCSIISLGLLVISSDTNKNKIATATLLGSLISIPFVLRSEFYNVDCYRRYLLIIQIEK